METPRPIPGWRPSTPAITGPELDDLIGRHHAIAIHFWATWDAHDRKLDEAIQAIRPQLAGRVHFVACDIDQDEDGRLCRRFGVVNIPALGLIGAGKIQPPPIIGVPTPADLAALIEARLRPPAPPPWWAFRRRGGG